MIIGNRLKKLRLERNLTQEELAKAIGLSTAQVSNYEKELRSPSNESLIELVLFFGVTSDYLIGIDCLTVIETNEKLENIPLTNEEVNFIAELRKDKMLYEILFANPKRGAKLIKQKII